jgi:hypothetical protein
MQRCASRGEGIDGIAAEQQAIVWPQELQATAQAIVSEGRMGK